MKFTLSWLKDHLDTDASLDAIVATLIAIGLEVEAVEDRAAPLAAFRIARVVSAVQHPNADRLRVLSVDQGDGVPIQVVCGAPNARAGLVGVFAAPGSLIPGTGVALETGTIRGVESRGMMLSEREMGLSDAHEGIVDLPADAPVGTPYVAWAELGDPVIEIAVTPNRADCLGIRGIARDLAAAGLGLLRPLDLAFMAGDRRSGAGEAEAVAAGVSAAASSEATSSAAVAGFPDATASAAAGDGPEPPEVTIAAPDLCPAFALRLIEGVYNGPSPDWLKRRLTAVGLRPINALVDVTNYLTYDVGRPLHVFDADAVAGALVVRRAHDGETVAALDGRSYPLTAQMCVIADDNEVESLAGVMGGAASGSSEATTRVLVESALWEPLAIARTGRTLGLHSDARHRFERGVDPEFMLPGLDRATAMILALCGGTAGPVRIAGDVPEPRAAILYPPAEVERLSGLSVAPARQREVLEALGFRVADGAEDGADGGGGDVPLPEAPRPAPTLPRPSASAALPTALWRVTPPSWRADVEGKADVVEEIVRIVGIDRVAAVPMPRPQAIAPRILTSRQQRVSTMRRAVAARGLVEAVTWSFVSHADALAFGGGAANLALANPIAEALSDMRPSLLPGLVRAITKNVNRGFPDIAVFEVGQVFAGDEPPDQTTMAAGVRQGRNRAAGDGRHWSHDGAVADVFDAKADILAALAAVGGPAERVDISRDAPGHYHPGRSGTLRLGANILGHFGELHPAVLAAMDAPERLVGFELTLEAIPEPRRKATRKPPIATSDLMPVRRDFAFVVAEDVDARAITKAARGARKDLVTDVSVFDVYRGQGVADGHKSVAIEATLQPKERTLTEKDIETVSDAIVAAVAKATGATLRR